jgi:hypothetical protein
MRDVFPYVNAPDIEVDLAAKLLHCYGFNTNTESKFCLSPAD